MDPTRRFSNRVENYIRFRPSYPASVMALLEQECGLSKTSVVADMGSGTGIFARLLLEHGSTVFAVEPNAEMRQAAERLLAGWPNFRSVPAPAEASTLAEASVDIITAAQAFHWFDREKCKREFRRILRKQGWVVLLWNDRRLEATPFMKAYEQFLRTCTTDYEKVNHKNIDERALREFFGREPEQKILFNQQRFDYESLRGRLLSSSYAPEAGQPGHEKMLRELESLFEKHNDHGVVTFEYNTRLFYGRLD